MFDAILNEILESRDDFMIDLATSVIKTYEKERADAIESLRISDDKETGDNFQEIYLFLVHLTSLVVASTALEIYANHDYDIDVCEEFLSDVSNNTANLIEQNLDEDDLIEGSDSVDLE